MQGNLCFTFPYYRRNKREYLCYFVPQGSSPEVHQRARQEAIRNYEYSIQESLGRLSKTQKEQMKQYTGTKTVKAKPMTYGEAHEKGFIHDDAFVEELSNRDGYHIVYPDNYESWSPAEVFDEAYSLSETPLDRLNIEIANLKQKIDKLGNFIFNKNDGKDFQALPLGKRAFLIAQFNTMCAYLNLAALRQSCMEGNEECRPAGLSFEQILPMLREGFSIRRSGWNGKGLMVFKQVPAHITSETIPTMQSLPDEAKRHILAAGDHIDYVAQCLIFNPQTGEANSWVPSISDVFANDWELVM